VSLKYLSPNEPEEPAEIAEEESQPKCNNVKKINTNLSNRIAWKPSSAESITTTNPQARKTMRKKRRSRRAKLPTSE